MGYGQYSDHSHGRQNPLARTPKTSKRQVFPTSEIAHKWAHQTQDSARNPQGNFYFRGATIYSYRDSWPLARIYRKRCAPTLGDAAAPASGVLVLSNCNRYSVTTRQHQSDVNRAVSHLERIAVPEVVPAYGADKFSKVQHEENIKYLLNVAAVALTCAQRALRVQRVEWEHGRAMRAIDDARNYMAFFGIRRKAPVFPTDAWAAALERARRIETPDPASLDRRERQWAKRQERNRERDEYLAEQRRSAHAAKHARDFYRVGAARSSWRLNGAWGADYEAIRSSACMLRLSGCNAAGCGAQPCDHSTEIETSWGARVPVAEAPFVWRLVGMIKRACATYTPPTTGLKRIMIGDYPLDRIDSDGTLHAGCHTIPYAELALMARTLNLTGE
jgi:hypothetical protein